MLAKDKLKDPKVFGMIMLVVGALSGFQGANFTNSPVNTTVTTAENLYVCPVTQELGRFDRLSDSGITGYYNESGIEESERCNEGYNYVSWMSLNDYAEAHNISKQEFIQDKTKETTGNWTQVCGRQGCFTCKAPIKAHSDCEGTIDSAGEIISPARR